MANTVTLAEMRTRALDLADMTGSTFPVTARVTDYINEGLSMLYDELVRSVSDFNISTNDFTLVSGTPTYNLPTDFYKCRKVFYVSQDRLYQIQKYSLDEISGYFEHPVSTGTLRMFYYPEFSKMTNDADEVADHLPLENGWEDAAVFHAAASLLEREESDSSRLAGKRDQTILRVREMCTPRDYGGTDKIVDRHNRFDQNYWIRTTNNRDYRYRVMGAKLYVIETDWRGI